MTGLSTDQYVSIGSTCPISTEIDLVAESAQVNIGSGLGRGDTLRLLVPDADTCHRLAQAFVEARNKLVESVYEAVPEHIPGPSTERAPADRVDARRLSGAAEPRS